MRPLVKSAPQSKILILGSVGHTDSRLRRNFQRCFFEKLQSKSVIAGRKLFDTLAGGTNAG